jgi:hypothetical protein
VTVADALYDVSLFAVDPPGNPFSPGVTSVHKRMTWDELVDFHRHSPQTPCRKHGCQPTEKDCIYKSGRGGIVYGLIPTGAIRNADNLVSYSCLAYDFDGITDGEFRLLRGWLEGRKCLIYSTHKHGLGEQPNNRIRIVFPLSKSVSPGEYKHVYDVFGAQIQNVTKGEDDSVYDESGSALARLFYLPTHT